MRRTLLMLCAAGAILGGCQTTSSNNPDSGTVTQVQAIATQVCGYLPTAQTVLQLLNVVGFSVPGSSVASDIATQICSVVTRKSARRGGRATLRGVTIRGRFVR